MSYDPDNHDLMVRLRAEKVRRVAQEIPPTTINGPAGGDLLVVGWGGTYGTITAAVEEAQAAGQSVASVHLRHLSPLPPDLGQILRQYRRVLVPEINSGQLVRVLRAEYLVDAVGFNRVRGVPLATQEHRGRDQPDGRGQPMSTERDRRPRATRRRTSSRTRTSAGAPAAGTTRSCRPSRR